MACTFSTSQLPKVVWDRQFLTILSCKCASRHSGVHFCDISTFKSGPNLACFVHFDLEMCFVQHRRASFSSLIWPAGSAPAALASLLVDPPELQTIGKAQWIATFLPFRAPASSCFPVFLFSSLLFSSLPFPSLPFPSLLFSSLLFSSLLFSSHFLTSPSWLFPPLLFHMSILSEVWLLNYSKLPSVIPRLSHYKPILSIIIPRHTMLPIMSSLWEGRSHG